MSEQYLGEIRIFSFNYAPTTWAQCNGQLLSIQSNTALFALLGTYYGGDGVRTFGLPNLQGRVPLGQGTSPQGSYTIGETAGEINHTVLVTEMPTHTHLFNGITGNATSNFPAGAIPASIAGGATTYYSSTAPNTAMSPSAISQTGGSQPHNNMAPYLTLNICIATTGIFPSRG